MLGRNDTNEGDSKGVISRLAKMRKPQCTAVHEDFRIKRNAESTLLSHPHIGKYGYMADK